MKNVNLNISEKEKADELSSFAFNGKDNFRINTIIPIFDRLKSSLNNRISSYINIDQTFSFFDNPLLNNQEIID